MYFFKWLWCVLYGWKMEAPRNKYSYAVYVHPDWNGVWGIERAFEVTEKSVHCKHVRTHIPEESEDKTPFCVVCARRINQEV